MIIPSAFPLSSGLKADTTIAIDVTLINANDIPRINRHIRNSLEVVTITLIMEIIMNRIMFIIVIFLRPYFPDICPAGTDNTATIKKNIIETQF